MSIKLQLTSVFLFLTCTLAVEAEENSVLGPKNYKGLPSTKSYTESPAIGQKEVSIIYKLKIKNADGKDHLIKDCDQPESKSHS